MESENLQNLYERQERAFNLIKEIYSEDRMLSEKDKKALKNKDYDEAMKICNRQIVLNRREMRLWDYLTKLDRKIDECPIGA